MADEAEKVINLSLCKMAESRTIRRGGSSLHKHLLISTVLTKARSAYFETWYMGDGEAIESTTGRSIDLNSSYQELDFPLDDEDDDDDFAVDDPNSAVDTTDSSTISYEPKNDPEEEMIGSGSNCGEEQQQQRISIDPRFFVAVESDNESEIELPTDILNCVEKLGDISDMSFTVDNNNLSSSSISCQNYASENSSPQSDESINSGTSTQLTYIDLDSSFANAKDSIIISDSDNNNEPNANLNNDETDSIEFGSPICTSTPNHRSSKRRRNWSIDESSDDDEENDGSCFRGGQSSSISFSKEFSDKLKRNGLSITNISTKRLRFSPECEQNEQDSGVSSPLKTSESTKLFPIINNNSEFRTKKSHFEEDETEDSDDDPFLGEALGQGPEFCDSLSTRRKNDQRVPSASNGSSSDEDGDHGETENCSEMEVDQITNLVQFFSFNKLSSSSQQTLLDSPLPSTHSSIIKSSSNTTMSRSISSPDLCGLSAAAASSKSSINSANNAKDLFQYNNSSANNNSNHMSHNRILTMKV